MRYTLQKEEPSQTRNLRFQLLRGGLLLIRAYMCTSTPVLPPNLYSQIGFAMLGGRRDDRPS